MTRTCSVTGCGKPVTGYGKYCPNHAKTKARHGHPLQRGVLRHELKPFEKVVEKWLSERSSPDALPILLDKVEGIAAEASIYCERPSHGRPFQRHKLQASDTILRVHQENKAHEVVIRMLAMGYLRHFDPRRFQSDEAFHVQLARQFRTLTDTNAGIYWDHKEGRTKKVYRDVPARTLRVLANIILETGLPHFGSQLGEADMKERSRRKHEVEEVTKALLGTTAFRGHGGHHPAEATSP